MKALIRWPLKAFWNRTRGLRRPVIERYASFLRRVQSQVIPAASSSPDSRWDCVVLELMRLQDQVERLQSSIDEMNLRRAELTVVDEDTAETRLRVG
jgi:hypothetical protein